MVVLRVEQFIARHYTLAYTFPPGSWKTRSYLDHLCRSICWSKVSLSIAVALAAEQARKQKLSLLNMRPHSDAVSLDDDYE